MNGLVLHPRLHEPETVRDYPVATIKAKHPEVGDIELEADLGEVTVYVGKHTHLHVGNYDDSAAAEVRAADIANQVGRFLEELLADRMYIWSERNIGGCQSKEDGWPETIVGPCQNVFVWSGPASPA